MQARLQERVAWEPVLQAKLEAAEAAKQRLLAAAEAVKQRLLDADDFDGVQAAEAGNVDDLRAADAELAAIQRALRYLRMTAEEAAAGECPLQQNRPQAKHCSFWRLPPCYPWLPLPPGPLSPPASAQLLCR